LCLTVIAGCYRKASEDGGLVFSLQPWGPLLVVLAGLAAVPVGIVFFMRKRRLQGVCLAIAGPIAVVAIAPTMFLDRVVVNRDGFCSRHGFWWNPTIHQVRYDELAQVRLSFEQRTGSRGRQEYTFYFDCSLKSGKTERVPLGDVIRQALPEIAEHFRQHGVTIQIPPNLPD
jgi:hypothetical protein